MCPKILFLPNNVHRFFSLSRVIQRGLNVSFMVQKLDQWISMNGKYCAVPFISQCNTPPADQGKSSNLNFQVITSWSSNQLYNLLSDATDMVFTLWVVHDRHHWKTESRNIKAIPLLMEKLHGGVDSFVSNWNCRNSSQATSSLEN